MSIEWILAVHEVRDEQKNLYRKAIYKATMDYLEGVKGVEPFGTHHKAPGEEFYGTFYWKAMVEYVMERDGHRCSICGCPDNLEVHHIIRRADGGSNNPVNLKLLCRKCHDDMHHNDSERCYSYIYMDFILRLEKELKSAYDMFVCGCDIPDGDKKFIEGANANISELADIVRSRDESYAETSTPFKKSKTKQLKLGGAQ